MSSCPDIHGCGRAHLTVGLEAVRRCPASTERTFHGTGSRYLHGLRPGDRLAVFLDSADGFHLQDDVSKPMIFVSAGTGFAPMRAFLWERLALRRHGRHARRGRAVQRPAVTAARLPVPRGGRPVRQPRACSITCTSRRRAKSPRAASTCRTASGVKARSCGGCCPKAATCTCAAHSRCVTRVRAAFVDVLAEHGEHAAPRAPKRSWPTWKTPERYRPDLWA